MGVEQVVSTVNALEPGVGLFEVFLLFGNLGQRKVGLHQAAAHFRTRCLRALDLRQVHVTFKGPLGHRCFAVLQFKDAPDQPGIGIVGFFRREDLQLGHRFSVALRVQQGADVFHAHFGLRLSVQVLFHNDFGLGRLRAHHGQGQQGGEIRLGVDDLSLAGRFHRAVDIACIKSHAPDHGPGRNADARRCQVARQRLLDCGGGQLFVAGTGKIARNGHDGRHAVFGVGCRYFAFERLQGFANSVQSDQNLQHVAIGFS